MAVDGVSSTCGPVPAPPPPPPPPPLAPQTTPATGYGTQVNGQTFQVCPTGQPCSAPPVDTWGSQPAGTAYRNTWDSVAAQLNTSNPIAIRNEIDRQLYQTQGLDGYRFTSPQYQVAPATTPASAATPTGEGPDPVQLGLDLTQMALDITGIIEPTPISDGSNTLISIGRGIGSLFSGNFGDAGGHALNGLMSAAGIIPYLGDAAKLGKIGKWAQTVADGISAIAHNPAARSAVEPGLRAIRDAVNSIPTSAIDSLPGSARDAINSMKRQLDEFFAPATRQADEAVPPPSSYTGTVRGASVDLPGVSTVNVNYVKRDRAAYADLRRAFDNGVRADFARHLADPSRVADLRRAGFDDAAIETLRNGRIPQGWQVHHKLPLDDGGTNSFDNLVLIKNDPYHIALTNAQRTLVGDLPVGGSRVVDFPVPNGSIYPPAPIP